MKTREKKGRAGFFREEHRIVDPKRFEGVHARITHTVGTGPGLLDRSLGAGLHILRLYTNYSAVYPFRDYLPILGSITMMNSTMMKVYHQDDHVSPR